MEKKPVNILLVDDDRATAHLYNEQLVKYGYTVFNVFTGSEAVAFLNNMDYPDLVLLDISPAMATERIETAREILKYGDIPFIFMITPGDEDLLPHTSDILSYGFFLKNSGGGLLRRAVESALNLHRTQRRRIADAKGIEEARYKDLVDNAGEAIIVAQDGMMKLFNHATCRLLEKSEEELYSTPFRNFIHPEDRGMVIENYMKRTTGSHAPSRYHFRIVTGEENVKWIEINSILYRWDNKPATLNFLTNITERKKMEDALRESELKYRNIFENVQDIFYQTDVNGNIIEISPSIERYAGFSRNELIGRPVTDVYSNPEDRAQLIRTLGEKGEVVDYELVLEDKNKNVIITSTNSHFMYDSDGDVIGIEGSLRDITARKNVEKALKQSLKQKEILMIELQHRIKNNLGIISSLLSLEMPRLKDDYAKEIFMNARNRILSMSGIYEQLYISGSIESVDLAEYITSLTRTIMNTYSVTRGNISMVSNVAPVNLDLKRTVPIGLILNELITNSLKYAYGDKEAGVVAVSLTEEKGDVTLTVSDSGVGIPEGFNLYKSDTMGLNLVSMLTEQINGKLKIENHKGTKVSITFRL